MIPKCVPVPAHLDAPVFTSAPIPIPIPIPAPASALIYTLLKYNLEKQNQPAKSEMCNICHNTIKVI